MGETPDEPTVLTTIADGSIRDGLGVLKDGSPDSVLDGSVIRALDAPDFEERGVVEFDISSLSGKINSATIGPSVFGSNGPFPFNIDLFGYSDTAASSVALNDWNSGSLLTTFVFNNDILEEKTLELNVTSFVQDKITAGESHVGFGFKFKNPSNINLNGPFVAFNSIEFPPAAKLTIE